MEGVVGRKMEEFGRNKDPSPWAQREEGPIMGKRKRDSEEEEVRGAPGGAWGPGMGDIGLREVRRHAGGALGVRAGAPAEDWQGSPWKWGKWYLLLVRQPTHRQIHPGMGCTGQNLRSVRQSS